ncbi:MAG: 1-deoxy-D-xylulose-5-phosphate reductoisomerase [Candidatus Marinimicrobia bacterium]|nr:1-deoxy-D-xylulose-5-phosphate reductoisomerase [Candidatus Neomarinimicrobiota bacterium]|tara:strand:- start:480 stop:1646 length:1167 start_codon:yes stop_codon:yes gene_type:complete
MRRSVGILGSTGSIGVNALEVLRHHRDRFSIKYLSAKSNSERLINQAIDIKPEVVAIIDARAAESVRDALKDHSVEVLAGRDGLLELASRNDVDICLNALVGSAGMEPTVRAMEAGVDVALSNKESLVMAGGIITEIIERKGVKLIPVDSEHSAIFQCLTGEENASVKRLILTGSGGPFRDRSIDLFSTVTVDEALAHPNWEMGRKITIDSATMMNKGLEVIEAYWLFKLSVDKIDIVIHPQSIIHSMVEFIDGSVKAQLGYPDMKIPIQYALTYPERLESDWEQFVPAELSDITFEEPDLEKFPSIRLAYETLARGGTAPAALNVANDHTVELFLSGTIAFPQILEINEAAVTSHNWVENPDISDILELERWGRSFVESNIEETVIA